ncbi:MAG: aminoacyl-histidine dipeptidase [Defluviitaleaceae bacterium]|nr:aminoacyl-histidine dipeptidase [Defluviitaleaceae bacterium]MCL2275986.1 aminoacyl-histidine dipeptidase [Defluviitaleaceae bacterium]
MVLGNLEPKVFFKNFEAISQIPRGSGDEKRVSDFVTNFARDLGYKVVQDTLNNVIIYKPASAGYESKPAVILQGHLDMVCEKNAGTEHDFTKNPLKLYIDGGFVKAHGTTLGADNGTAVAICMAILEDKALQHPALEMVLTVEEETGMAGAENLEASLFKATRMLNLDSSDEGVITIGCAAGVTVEYSIPLAFDAVPQDYSAFTIQVKGLHGGHSGADIHKGRGNALVMMGCVLGALEKDCGIRLAHIHGGMKLNAIPREATAEILVPAAHAEALKTAIAGCKRTFGEMYKATEPTLEISCAAGTLPSRIFSAECSDKIIATLLLLPNGVQAMSQEMEGVVAASCNVGVVHTLKDAIKIECFPRGATAFHLQGMEQQIRALAGRTGAQANFIQRSPAWAFDANSALLKEVVAVYEKQYGSAPVVTALHAGLECGILAEKLPGLDIVSLGPNTHDLHTPDERLSIASVGRVWAMIVALLGRL